MADEISIKIKILDKEYPSRIPAAEEETYRQAGKELNERLRQLRETYGSRADKQDLLSLVAFVMAVENLKLKDEKSTLDEVLVRKMSRLTDLLNLS